jgi:hypothetical protein
MPVCAVCSYVSDLQFFYGAHGHTYTFSILQWFCTCPNPLHYWKTSWLPRYPVKQIEPTTNKPKHVMKQARQTNQATHQLRQHFDACWQSREAGGFMAFWGEVESILTGMDVSALQGALERRQMHPRCRQTTFSILQQIWACPRPLHYWKWHGHVFRSYYNTCFEVCVCLGT